MNTQTNFLTSDLKYFSMLYENSTAYLSLYKQLGNIEKVLVWLPIHLETRELLISILN